VFAGQEVRPPAFDSHEIVAGACAAAAGAVADGPAPAFWACALRTQTTAINNSSDAMER